MSADPNFRVGEGVGLFAEAPAVGLAHRLCSQCANHIFRTDGTPPMHNFPAHLLVARTSRLLPTKGPVT